MSDNLNVNQEKFLNKYIETGNKVQSYMESYDNENYQGSAASSVRLLKNAKVKKAYEEKMEELRQLSALTIEQTKLALTDEYINGTKGSDRIKALDILNKMNGVYIEKIESDNNINVEIGGNLKTWAE